jgi:hypothetical protein
LAGAAALLVLTLAFCACGSEQDRGKAARGADSDWNVSALVDRVPSEANEIVAMDTAAAKRELGVAADLDPKGYRALEENGSPEDAFNSAALSTMGYLTGVGPTPLAAAIDHGAITAAVHAFLPLAGGDLHIFRTTQSAASLRRGLKKVGTTQVSKDVYALTKVPKLTQLTVIGLGPDGLVAVGETSAVVTGVLQRTAPDPRLAPMRRMLDSAAGARRYVHSYVTQPPDAAPCIRRVAAGQRFTAGNPDEDLVLELTGEPRAGEVTFGSSVTRKEYTMRVFRLGAVARNGQLLTLKVRTPEGLDSRANAIAVANNVFDVDLLYRCPGAAAAAARRVAQQQRDKLPDPIEPDRSGSPLETAISQYIIRGTGQPPPAVKVRCPDKTVPPGTKVLNCTGTRRRKGRLLHYTLKVHFGIGRIDFIDADTPDDTSGEIVSKEDLRKNARARAKARARARARARAKG